MTDLTEVITSSMEDASMPEPAVDAGSSGTTDSGHDSSLGVMSTALSSDTPIVPDATAATPHADDIERLLAEQGVNKGDGTRENRIPYSRVKKITEKAIKDREATWEKERTDFGGKLTKAEERVKFFEQLDKVAGTEPERYLQALAKVNPWYQQVLEAHKRGAMAPAATSATGPAKPSTPVDDPMPQPDARFPDGTAGYSPDTHQKLLDWHGRQIRREAVNEALEQVVKRFQPMEDQFRAAEMVKAQAPIIQHKIRQMEELWGKDLLKANETELATVLRNDPKISFEAACMQVLLPKDRARLHTERTKLRTEILEELNKRPHAATRTAPASASAGAVTSPHGSLEDVIRASMATIR